MPIQVLLVDDHALMVDGLKALFRATPDIEVIGTAGDGIEAVAQAERLGPDVVVLDIEMPMLNGIDALRELRRKCPTSRVLIVSMHCSSEHLHRARRGGALGYILKESAGSEAISAVRAVHAGRRYLSPALDRIEHVAAGTRRRSSPLDSLSPRERQVLQLVVEGHSSARIAAVTQLSPKTVETYRSRLMGKLEVTGVAALVKFAIQHGLTPRN